MDALVIGVLGALIGVVGGFLAARHIDRLGARRTVYTAYIGAVESTGWTMRRRLFALRDYPDARPRPPMADVQRVNDALGEMWTVAPPDMLAIVERMQDHLKAMELLSVPSRADAHAITEAIKTFDDLREELVNRARAQSGERGLPSATFRQY